LSYLAWASQLSNIDYIDEGDDIKFTPQALSAREILELYNWWTKVYPNRPSPYEASGWGAVCEASRAANGGRLHFGIEKDPALKKTSDEALKLLQKIEKAYEDEDEEMMVRLIRVRHGLWT
jgi:phosphate uptake regulator